MKHRSLVFSALLVSCTSGGLVSSPLPPAVPSVVIPAASVSEPPAPRALAVLDLRVSVAAEGKASQDLDLHPLRGALVFQSGARYARLAGDRLVEDPTLSRGVPPRSTATIFFGDWPAAVWAQFRDDAATGADARSGALYRYHKDRFVLVKKTRSDVYYDGPYYGGAGRMGAISSAHFDEGNQTWIEILDGPKAGAIPKPAELANGFARVGIHHTLALPSGQLLTHGLDTSLPTTPDVIERWEAGATESIVERVLAGARLQHTSLVGRVSTEVYLGGEITVDGSPTGLGLFRFDGAHWSRVDVPEALLGRGAPGFAVGEDGVLWMVRRGDGPGLSLFRRAADGEWATAPLPESAGAEPRQIVALGANDVFVLATTDAGRFVLLRTQAVGERLRF